MPCLSLRKNLFPSIKTWKSFTAKILQKLHHPYKIIKISKTRSHRAKTIRSRAQPPSYYPTPSKKNRRRYTSKNRRHIFGATTALHRPRHENRFKKRCLAAPAPVFVDELFWTQTKDAVSGGPMGKPGPMMRSEVVGPEMVSRVVPRLRGIDARAEEFITRFRAELEYQEIEAHGS